jgi:hypothetical protein
VKAAAELDASQALAAAADGEGSAVPDLLPLSLPAAAAESPATGTGPEQQQQQQQQQQEQQEQVLQQELDTLLVAMLRQDHSSVDMCLGLPSTTAPDISHPAAAAAAAAAGAQGTLFGCTDNNTATAMAAQMQARGQAGLAVLAAATAAAAKAAAGTCNGLTMLAQPRNAVATAEAATAVPAAAHQLPQQALAPPNSTNLSPGSTAAAGAPPATAAVAYANTGLQGIQQNLMPKQQYAEIWKQQQQQQQQQKALAACAAGTCGSCSMCIDRAISNLSEQLLLFARGQSGSSSSTSSVAHVAGTGTLEQLLNSLMLAPATAASPLASIGNVALTEQQLQQMLHDQLTMPLLDRAQQQLQMQHQALSKMVLQTRRQLQQVQRKLQLLVGRRLSQQRGQVTGNSAGVPLTVDGGDLPGQAAADGWRAVRPRL